MQKYPAQIAAGEFKAKCLQLMNQVNETHVAITITKHGIPIAKLVPVEEQSVALFGIQQDAMVINGDIVSPIDEAWDADK